MLEVLVELLARFLVAALDRVVDRELAKLPGPVHRSLEELEDQIIRMLGPFVGEVAKKWAKNVIAEGLRRRFPNDPSTWVWG